MNHRANSDSDGEEELAEVSLPSGIIIRIGQKKSKMTKGEIRDAFGACNNQGLPKMVSISSSESPSSESPSSESSSEQSSPKIVREKMEKAIRALIGGYK